MHYFVLCFKARRSLVFASHLRDIGDEFRKRFLDSDDISDNTIWDDDWTQMEVRAMLIILHHYSLINTIIINNQ